MEQQEAVVLEYLIPVRSSTVHQWLKRSLLVATVVEEAVELLRLSN